MGVWSNKAYSSLDTVKQKSWWTETISTWRLGPHGWHRGSNGTWLGCRVRCHEKATDKGSRPGTQNAKIQMPVYWKHRLEGATAVAQNTRARRPLEPCLSHGSYVRAWWKSNSVIRTVGKPESWNWSEGADARENQGNTAVSGSSPFLRSNGCRQETGWVYKDIKMEGWEGGTGRPYEPQVLHSTDWAREYWACKFMFHVDITAGICHYPKDHP